MKIYEKFIIWATLCLILSCLNVQIFLLPWILIQEAKMLQIQRIQIPSPAWNHLQTALFSLTPCMSRSSSFLIIPAFSFPEHHKLLVYYLLKHFIIWLKIYHILWRCTKTLKFGWKGSIPLSFEYIWTNSHS